MKNTVFTGAGVALVTPFHLDGSVNYEALGTLIDYQIDNGTDALIVAATTGEGSTLTEEEHIEVIRYAVEYTKHRVPVIAGTGSNDTAFCIRLSQAALDAGADALLLVTPYYNKTSQNGLYAHFTMIANRIDLPIILYNVPSRTGMSIDVEMLARLASHKNIVGIKEASGNISYVARVIERCGDRLDVYCGNDDQIVPMMALGAKGAISVLSNILPKETHQLTKAALEGDFRTAAALQLKYLSLMNALFVEVNPIPVKEAMNLMGMNVGTCRLPLFKMAEENATTLIAAMQQHKLVPELEPDKPVPTE